MCSWCQLNAMSYIRDICMHCRKPIYGRGSASGVRVWKHMPMWNPNDCETPEPYPYPKWDCTCEDAHPFCRRVDCKCDGHKGRIN